MLYIVATPIGNLGDMTYRAVETLQGVDWIAAEDTRHTGKLLQAYSIKTPQLSYHDHNRSRRGPEIIAKLQAGAAIALVSDAGVPGISDPGYELVQSCWAAGLRVVPIPGVSAVTTALSASGLSPERFVFEGFLPPKSKARRAAIAALKDDPRTLVFYESPHRLRDTLVDLAESLEPERAITLARELTKLHEEFWRGSLAAAIAHYQDHRPQGEFTLVVEGAMPMVQNWSAAELEAALQALLDQGLSRSEASRQLAQRSGQSKRDLYQLSLGLENPRED
jgi:16S rRNA (cytidine1402-2'-O)-methyltransferase